MARALGPGGPQAQNGPDPWLPMAQMLLAADAAWILAGPESEVHAAPHAAQPLPRPQRIDRLFSHAQGSDAQASVFLLKPASEVL